MGLHAYNGQFKEGVTLLGPLISDDKITESLLLQGTTDQLSPVDQYLANVSQGIACIGNLRSRGECVGGLGGSLGNLSWGRKGRMRMGWGERACRTSRCGSDIKCTVV